jgi:hypothetical protein
MIPLSAVRSGSAMILSLNYILFGTSLTSISIFEPSSIEHLLVSASQMVVQDTRPGDPHRLFISGAARSNALPNWRDFILPRK